MNLLAFFTWDIAVFLIKLFFYTCWGFLACIKLKEMKQRGTLIRFWKIIGSPLVVIFLVLDFLFNTFWGSIIYREKPRLWGPNRELLFTDRCKRHYRAVEYSLVKPPRDEKTMKRYRIARRWKERLDVVEMNHIY